MKLNRLETHDRFQHFGKQDFDIGACCQDMLNKRPFGNRPFYMFAHARTEDDDVSKKRLIWQPRLTRPTPADNSMLFRGTPGSDNVEIIWIIPQRELWKNFGKGQLTENEMIAEFIYLFKHDREKLAAPHPDDPTDAEVAAIYEEISRAANFAKNDVFVKI